MNYFENNWRLSKEKFTKSIFKLNCNYNEHTPVELVQAFIKNKQGISLKNNRILKGKYDNEETQMQEYMKKFDKKTNTFKVKYIIPAHRWGRINPNKSLSLCVFHRPTRHAYCRGIYKDIDMKNAHPVIIKNLCKMNNIPCPNITLYCNDRDEFLGKICLHHGVDKETAKRLILRLTYGGEYNRWLSEVELKQQSIKTPLQKVLDYEAEMTTVRDIVFQHNSHIISDVEKADPLYFKNPKYKTPEDVLRKKKKTCMSHFCCTIERHLQEACIKHLVEKKGFSLNDIVPCQDGFMILENLYYDNILDEYQEVIKNTLGFDIELKVKDFDEACDIPVNTSHEVSHEVTETKNDVGVTSDLEAAQKIYSLYPHWKYCLGSLYVFDDLEGLWTDNSVVQVKIFNRYADKLFLLIPGKDNKMIKTNKSYGSNTSYQKQMIDQLKAQCIDNHWIRRSQSSSLHYLLFNNGYLSLKEEKFYDKETYGFNPDIIFTGKIPHDFGVINKPYMHDIERRFFHNPLGWEVGNYLIYILARALGGDVLKNVVFGLGDTNCGKSVLTAAIMQSCGDYVGSFNAENLVYNRSSNDEAQKMRWALLLAKKRIIFSNEMKNTVEINGNMLKKISSGGDTLIGRTHGGTETEFVTHFLPVCFANDIPKIKPYDAAVDDRLRVISFNKQFVENPENEFELKKDENIYSEIKTIEFQKAFVGLLIFNYWNYYQLKMDGNEPRIPLEVVNAKKEWITEDQNNVITMFLNDYIVTNNDKDFIRSNTLKSWLDDKKVGISMEKFTKDLKKYLVLHHLDNVVNKHKKIEGKSLMCWFGIKEVRYSPEHADVDVSNEEYIFEEI